MKFCQNALKSYVQRYNTEVEQENEKCVPNIVRI